MLSSDTKTYEQNERLTEKIQLTFGNKEMDPLFSKFTKSKKN